MQLKGAAVVASGSRVPQGDRLLGQGGQHGGKGEGRVEKVVDRAQHDLARNALRQQVGDGVKVSAELLDTRNKRNPLMTRLSVGTLTCAHGTTL